MIKSTVLREERIKDMIANLAGLACVAVLVIFAFAYASEASQRRDREQARQDYELSVSLANFDLLEDCKKLTEFVKDIMSFGIDIEDLDNVVVYSADELYTTFRYDKILIQIRPGKIQPTWAIWKDESLGDNLW